MGIESSVATFVWVPVEGEEVTPKESKEVVRVKGILGCEVKHCISVDIKMNAKHKYELGHKIVSMRMKEAPEKAYTNRVIAHFCGHGEVGLAASGNVLLVRMKSRQYEDMDLLDWGHTIDWYGWNTKWHDDISLGRVLYDHADVRAVAVLCLRDQKLSGKKEFDTTMVSSSHWIFSNSSSEPDVARKVGMPLVTSRRAHDIEWPKKVDGRRSSKNDAMTWLHIDCDPKSEWFGTVPVKMWREDVGSVFVAREDMKVLVPKQLEALCAFCEQYLRVKFEANRKQGLAAEKSSEIEELMTPDAYRQWFDTYREQKIGEGEKDWEYVECQ